MEERGRENHGCYDEHQMELFEEGDPNNVGWVKAVLFLLFCVGLIIFGLVSQAEAQTEVTIYRLGEQHHLNGNARACWTQEDAMQAASFLETMPFRAWLVGWQKARMMGVCAQGRVDVKFIEVVADEDGNWRTWTDMNGDVWRVVRCEAWFNGETDGEPSTIFLLLMNPIESPDGYTPASGESHTSGTAI